VWAQLCKTTTVSVDWYGYEICVRTESELQCLKWISWYIPKGWRLYRCQNETTRERLTRFELNKMIDSVRRNRIEFIKPKIKSKESDLRRYIKFVDKKNRSQKKTRNNTGWRRIWRLTCYWWHPNFDIDFDFKYSILICFSIWRNS
jgi:hypothetical protein